MVRLNCSSKFIYALNSFFKTKQQNKLKPVDFAAAPIKTAGTAITKHPKAATNDKTWARPGDFEERTR